jgi:hypothetical protein
MKTPDNHRRVFQIAGITVWVESDLDFGSIRFKPELAAFAVDEPGDDRVTLRHHFKPPDLEGHDLGVMLYQKAPWAISCRENTWYYRTLPLDAFHYPWHKVALFNTPHTQGTIYSPPCKADQIHTEGWESLSLFTTDQIWLAPVLADRNAVLLHSGAAILNGQGLLFVGHSDAGKSTTMTLLKNATTNAEILCDDRNVVRRWDGGWRVHGTWSHGDVADVSPASAPLGAILFLQQDACNQITPLTDRRQIWRSLLATLIRSVVTADWWQKEMDVLEGIVESVPCYTMRFDKSGAIVDKLASL